MAEPLTRVEAQARAEEIRAFALELARLETAQVRMPMFPSKSARWRWPTNSGKASGWRHLNFASLMMWRPGCRSVAGTCSLNLTLCSRESPLVAQSVSNGACGANLFVEHRLGSKDHIALNLNFRRFDPRPGMAK
jgi:hypothetical protein